MEAVEKESQTAPAAEKASKIKKPAPFVSIDAEYTRDIDDAIAVDKVPEGIRIQVAIANASAHVPIGCAEDIEAQRVGATVYAARRVLHRMLPKRISERMGSLVEGENRKAVVFEIILSEQLEVIRFRPHVRTIKVRARLSYDDIPAILDAAAHPLKPFLIIAANLSRALLGRRRKRGALAMYDMAMMLVMDEDGNVRQMESKGETIGNIIVQEMMILASEVTAPYLIEHDIPCVFRNHEPKSAAPPVSELAMSVDQWLTTETLDYGVIRDRLRLVAGKAKYEAVCRGHYALNLNAYGHFTSPLRRYPDLLNQRQLVAHLAGKPLPYTKEDLVHLAAGINEAIERRKTERSEGFAAAVNRAAIKAVENNRLLRAADHELCVAIKMYSARTEFPSVLTAEIIRRLKQQAVTDQVVICLMFEVEPDQIPFDVRQETLIWLAAKPEKAISLCSIGRQSKSLSDVEFTTAPTTTGGYVATAVAKFGGQEHRAAGTGPRKKDAEQAAALDLMAQKLRVTSLRTEQATQSAPVPAVVNKNMKGALLEFCSMRKFQAPVFEINSVGPDHVKTFSGTAKLDAEGVMHEVSVTNCATKRLAEALASERLLALLTGRLVVSAEVPVADDASMAKPVSISERPSLSRGEPAAGEPRARAVPPEPGLLGNPKGALLEFCAKNRLSPPVFEISGVGPSNAVRFSGSVSVVVDGSPLQAQVANCGSRKMAEARAAEQLLALIRPDQGRAQLVTSERNVTAAVPLPNAASVGEGVRAPKADEPVGTFAAVQPVPVGNPKGVLLELCSKRKLPAPVFEIAGAGPAHAMRFSGFATLDVGTAQHRVTIENCATKKLAEASAAEKLLGMLDVGDLEAPATGSPSLLDLLRTARESTNPIGALQEVAQRIGAPIPTYQVAQAPGAAVWFKSEVTTHHDGIQKYSGDGASKQIAKMAAARAALAQRSGD